MWRYLLSIISLLALVEPAAATAFTSNCTSPCNWNNGASWTGGSGSNWPATSSDTATILGQQVVTIPNGVSITTGLVSLSAGSGSNRTTLQVNGTLSLTGGLNLNGVASLNCGDHVTTGGTIDLNGTTVTNTTNDGQFNWLGISSAHCIIQSTGSAGVFTDTGTSQLISNWDYVDISNMGTSMFGRGASLANSMQQYQHSTFSNMADIYLEATAGGGTSGILVSHCDFRFPKTNAAQQPIITFVATTCTSGCSNRRLEYTTWYNAAATTSTARMTLTGHGMVLDHDVIVDWQHNDSVGGGPSDAVMQYTYSSNHTNVNAFLAVIGASPATLDNVYLYTATNAASNAVHAMYPAGNFTVTNSVLEWPVTGTCCGLKWFLNGAQPFTSTWTIHNNLMLGQATFMDFPADVTSTLAPTILFYNNTVFEDMRNSIESTPSATFMRVDHPFGVITGTNVQFYSNLAAQPSTSIAQNTLVSLWQTVVNQVTFADYNAYFKLPATAYSISGLAYSVGCSVTATNCGGPPIDYNNSSGAFTAPIATHDLSVNPNFVDSTRNLLAWDSSLGGPGTEADASAQLLRLNGTGGAFSPTFTVDNLLTYVKAGFVPQNTALHGAGLSGTDIGAYPVAGGGGGGGGGGGAGAGGIVQ